MNVGKSKVMVFEKVIEDVTDFGKTILELG